MTRPFYRTPTVEDIAHVAANMRQEDVLEVAASHGHTPTQALTASILASDFSLCCVMGDEPVCIFGAVEAGEDAASVWLLGSEGLHKYPRTLTAEARRLLPSWARTYGALFNYVSEDSKTTLLWLKRLGFSFGDPEVRGPFDSTFIPVTFSHV